MGPADILASLISTVEIRSRLFDPIIMDMNGTPGAGSELLNEVQPAVILHFKTGGQYTIAPGGMPTGGVSDELKNASVETLVGVGAGAVGLWLLARAIFK